MHLRRLSRLAVALALGAALASPGAAADCVGDCHGVYQSCAANAKTMQDLAQCSIDFTSCVNTKCIDNLYLTE